MLLCRSNKDQYITPEGTDYGFHRNHLIRLTHPGISTTLALLEDTGIDARNQHIILMSSVSKQTFINSVIILIIMISDSLNAPRD